MSLPTFQEQQHPQERSDRLIVDRLLREGVSNHNLTELARLRIRYRNFPGARTIQRDLDSLLTKWHLTEEQLFARTREIYAEGLPYQRPTEMPQEDWS